MSTEEKLSEPMTPSSPSQAERAPARLELRFERAEQAARALRAYSLNFSVGGLCLKPQREYEVGTRLRLALSVEKMDFDLAGTVAWARGGAIGVRFDSLSEEDRLRLTEILSALKR